MATAKKNTKKKTKPQTINGAEIMVQALVEQKVSHIFAYPGGASMPLHQALLKASDQLRTILPRHEQGGGFAAHGLARTTGEVGVCMATSGPGATNLVTTIADAKLDSVPMVAITGQVPTSVIGTDAFQETPIVEVCRGICKHTYLITELEDVPRVIKEAFHIAKSGRPGPVLVDFPKDVQLQTQEETPNYDPAMKLPGYHPELREAAPEQIKQIIAALKRSKRPVLYVGGGCINSDASEELVKFALRAKIPVTTTLMGIGSFPGDHPLALDMLGMHGTVYANFAIDQADLLLAFGVRFDDRVTGKLQEFAKHGKIVHVDIDPSEIHKNKLAHIPIVADLKSVLLKLNEQLTDDDIPNIEQWDKQILQWKEKYPLPLLESDQYILQTYAIHEMWKKTIDRDPLIATGVGQHQMWTAQYFKFRKPRRWMTSAGLGTMGFGLPAAMGAQAAYPDRLVIDVDGDGSILMNIQELATLHCEKLPVKILLLNNQHLGMVMQWEDRFLKGQRAHTYLGPIDHPEALGKGDGSHNEDTYPNFVQIAEGFGVQARQVRTKADFAEGLDEMINSTGPYLLDVICPYQEHVLPMIPTGGSARDIIVD